MDHSEKNISRLRKMISLWKHFYRGEKRHASTLEVIRTSKIHIFHFLLHFLTELRIPIIYFNYFQKPKEPSSRGKYNGGAALNVSFYCLSILKGTLLKSNGPFQKLENLNFLTLFQF